MNTPRIPRRRATPQAASSTIPDLHAANPRVDLAKQADALLKSAGCDSMTGAKVDRHYLRNKSAQQKRLGRYRRERRKQLGKFGAASKVRTIKS